MRIPLLWAPIPVIVTTVPDMGNFSSFRHRDHLFRVRDHRFR